MHWLSVNKYLRTNTLPHASVTLVETTQSYVELHVRTSEAMLCGGHLVTAS